MLCPGIRIYQTKKLTLMKKQNRMQITPVKRIVRNINNLLENGETTPENVFATLRFAVDGSGDPEAMTALARCYREGIGCEPDRANAVSLLSRAAEKGWAEAQYSLGMRYYLGDLVEKDLVEAARWFGAAANQEYPLASVYLGRCGVDIVLPVAPADPETDDPVPVDPEDLEDLVDDETLLLDNFLEYTLSGEHARYAVYDSANPGCSEDNPVVIRDRRDIREREAALLEGFLCTIPHRYVDYEVERRVETVRNGRHLDHWTVRVYTHPLLAEGEDGRPYLPQRRYLGTEDYWFDVTAGWKDLERASAVAAEELWEELELYAED